MLIKNIFTTKIMSLLMTDVSFVSYSSRSSNKILLFKLVYMHALQCKTKKNIDNMFYLQPSFYTRSNQMPVAYSYDVASSFDPKPIYSNDQLFVVSSRSAFILGQLNDL